MVAIDGALERHQLEVVQTRSIGLDHGEANVRVHAGVAVPGKMLARGEGAAGASASRIRRSGPWAPSGRKGWMQT